MNPESKYTHCCTFCSMPKLTRQAFMEHLFGKRHKNATSRKVNQLKWNERSLVLQGAKRLKIVEAAIAFLTPLADLGMIDVNITVPTTIIITFDSVDSAENALENFDPPYGYLCRFSECDNYDLEFLKEKITETKTNVVHDLSNDVMDLLRLQPNFAKFTMKRKESELEAMCLAVVNDIQLTQQDYDLRTFMRKRLENYLQRDFPNCKVFLFGSSANGLGFLGSDVDVVVDLGFNAFLGTEEEVKHNVNRVCRTMINLIRKNQLGTHAIAITGAKVPIVKFRVPRYNSVEVDISFKNCIPVFNTELISFYCQMHPLVRPYLVILKYWGKVQGLVGGGAPTVKMSSYTFAMLCLTYLMFRREPLVPGVGRLQEALITEDPSQMIVIDGWKCNFHRDLASWVQNRKKYVSLLALIREFFKFITDFDNEKFVLCPLQGAMVAKFYIRNHYFIEKYGFMRDFCEYKLDFPVNKTFCVQDPFEQNKNLTSAFPRSRVDIFKSACVKALTVIDDIYEGKVSLLDLFVPFDTSTMTEGGTNSKTKAPHHDDDSENPKNVNHPTSAEEEKRAADAAAAAARKQRLKNKKQKQRQAAKKKKRLGIPVNSHYTTPKKTENQRDFTSTDAQQDSEGNEKCQKDKTSHITSSNCGSVSDISQPSAKDTGNDADGNGDKQDTTSGQELTQEEEEMMETMRFCKFRCEKEKYDHPGDKSTSKKYTEIRISDKSADNLEGEKSGENVDGEKSAMNEEEIIAAMGFSSFKCEKSKHDDFFDKNTPNSPQNTSENPKNNDKFPKNPKNNDKFPKNPKNNDKFPKNPKNNDNKNAKNSKNEDEMMASMGFSSFKCEKQKHDQFSNKNTSNKGADNVKGKQNKKSKKKPNKFFGKNAGGKNLRLNPCNAVIERIKKDANTVKPPSNTRISKDFRSNFWTNLTNNTPNFPNINKEEGTFARLNLQQNNSGSGIDNFRRGVTDKPNLAYSQSFKMMDRNNYQTNSNFNSELSLNSSFRRNDQMNATNRSLSTSNWGENCDQEYIQRQNLDSMRRAGLNFNNDNSSFPNNRLGGIESNPNYCQGGSRDFGLNQNNMMGNSGFCGQKRSGFDFDGDRLGGIVSDHNYGQDRIKDFGFHQSTMMGNSGFGGQKRSDFNFDGDRLGGIVSNPNYGQGGSRDIGLNQNNMMGNSGFGGQKRSGFDFDGDQIKKRRICDFVNDNYGGMGQYSGNV